MAASGNIGVSEEPNNVVPLPGIRRGRGRPPGSRNKVSKSAKQLLDLHGKGAIETLCAIAAGHVVYGPPNDAGERERLNPSLDQRLQAARFIGDKLLPTLKAVEQDIAASVVNESIEPTEPTNRDIAKSVLALLSRGVPDGGRVTVETPDTYTARFTDKALGRRILGDSQSPVGAFSEAAASQEPPADSEPRTPGYSVLVAQGQGRIICCEGQNGGPWQWRVYREADQMELRRFSSEADATAWAEARLKERGSL